MYGCSMDQRLILPRPRPGAARAVVDSGLNAVPHRAGKHAGDCQDHSCQRQPKLHGSSSGLHRARRDLGLLVQADRLGPLAGRSPPGPQFSPRLSETRSDDQELREADAARRGLRNNKRNCSESRAHEGHNEPTRSESGQRQDDSRYQQHQKAQIHGDPVIVHPTLVLIEAAEPGGEDEQHQRSYCRRAPPTLQEVTLSHRKPRRNDTASGVPR